MFVCSSNFLYLVASISNNKTSKVYFVGLFEREISCSIFTSIQNVNEKRFPKFSLITHNQYHPCMGFLSALFGNKSL